MRVLPRVLTGAQTQHVGPITTNVLPVPTALDTDRHTLCYHLTPMHALPSFDSRRLLQSRLCSSSLRQKWNQFMRKHRRLVTAGYFVGLFYRLYGLVVPARYSGGYTLLVAALLQLPAVLNTTLSLSAEFFAHMALTFEFWYFCVTNTVGVVGLAVVFQDVRASLCFVTWLEIENARLADAYCTTSSSISSIVGVAGLGAVYFSSIAIAVALRAIEFHSIVLWHTPRGLKLHLEDVIVSAFATVGLLMGRIVFRKRNALRRTRAPVEVECISYQCRLQFVAGEPISRRVRSLTASFDEPWRVQLHEIVEPHVFDASNVIITGVWDPDTLQDCPRWLQHLWLALLALASATLVGLCFSAFRVPLNAEDTQKHVNYPLVIATIVAHALAASPFVGFQHRELLRLLFHSFDYIFLLASGVSASATLCYLCLWRPDHCAIQFCVCLWFYVAITSDALTPVTKKLLGCSFRRRAALACVLLAAQILLVLEITVFGQLGISDRIVFDRPLFVNHRHRITISSISFVLTRTITTIVWSSQILLLLWFSGSDYNDLILLQGGAEYAQARRRKRRDSNPSPAIS